MLDLIRKLLLGGKQPEYVTIIVDESVQVGTEFANVFSLLKQMDKIAA